MTVADSMSSTKSLAPLGLAALLTGMSFWFQVGAAVSGVWVDTAPQTSEPPTADGPPRLK
ncbi:hypothetical protein EAS62_39490 [Bradyrhizobium zhanjiangense]|uniref:Uncharacterized protein n=1 Tax=Bradyrhizobium zhanjiangense TaxID=1325107 RepID=A0ABY0D8H6_9BRAD|nr:hypothetical protein EAS62_39490 [Bradyrhizobium zhanjiangense]